MNNGDSQEVIEHARSSLVRRLVQQQCSKSSVESSLLAKKLPKKIVQFWDDLKHLPEDVSDCICTWKKIENQGFERVLFDKTQAGDYIHSNLGLRFKRAYDKCYHPAMQSDYFRLCYIFIEGGCYIDTDDVFDGAEIQHLFSDGRLKLQPLCYDIATNTMVPPEIFTEPGSNAKSWIFYFNNNPLIACREHPLVYRALIQATLSLEKNITDGLPEIQSTTGPGNLTKSIFEAITESSEIEQTLLVLRNWQNISKTKWELSYRNDSRNWRLSNCLAY